MAFLLHIQVGEITLNEIIVRVKADHIILLRGKRQFSMRSRVKFVAPGSRESVYSPRVEHRLINFLAITHLPPKTTHSTCTIPDINHLTSNNMRLQILTLLSSLFVFVLATGSLEDKSIIKDLLALFDVLFDDKAYSKLDKTLTPDVTYDPGDGPVQGLPAAINTLSKIVPEKIVSQTLLSTKLIKFLPPFDKGGRSNRAEAFSYNTFTFFGPANSTDPLLILFAKFVDKEIVRTNEPGLGGWRIKNRKFELVVSLSLTTRTHDSYHPPRVWTLIVAICRDQSETSTF